MTKQTTESTTSFDTTSWPSLHDRIVEQMSTGWNQPGRASSGRTTSTHSRRRGVCLLLTVPQQAARPHQHHLCKPFARLAAGDVSTLPAALRLVIAGTSFESARAAQRGQLLLAAEWFDYACAATRAVGIYRLRIAEANQRERYAYEALVARYGSDSRRVRGFAAKDEERYWATQRTIARELRALGGCYLPVIATAMVRDDWTLLVPVLQPLQPTTSTISSKRGY